MSKIIRDRFALNSDLRVGSVQRPPFKGVLYRDDGVNEYGRHVFTKVNENIVTLGGSITALEKLAGVTAAFKPNSINDIMGINTGHDYHPEATPVLRQWFRSQCEAEHRSRYGSHDGFRERSHWGRCL